MNFSDSIKKIAIDGAMKKEEVFNETFINKDNLKHKINLIRNLSEENAPLEEINEVIFAFCDLVDSMIDSEPEVTINIKK